MDKRLVGQWYKEEMGETLNIFDEVPLRMKMSFTSSGYYNFEPNCVYEKDGDLCFEINDEYYRMVYRVRFEDGALTGYYTQFGKRTDIVYTRVSDVPADELYRYLPTELYVPASEKTRLEVLREYADYAPEPDEIDETEYVLGGEAPGILTKYGYADHIKDIAASDDRLVFRLLDFVCDHFGHNGSGGLGNGRSIEALIAFCESNDGKTNCRGLAILLASLLRLNGIRARHITCMPYEDPFEDCHVVVDCLLPSGKRIMLDPTFRLYYKDKNGLYLSLRDLRKALIDGAEIVPNPDASYNGGAFNAAYNRDYMTKNTFRFSRGTYYTDGVDDNARQRVELIPVNYDTGNFPNAYKCEFVYNAECFWKI